MLQVQTEEDTCCNTVHVPDVLESLVVMDLNRQSTLESVELSSRITEVPFYARLHRTIDRSTTAS